MHATVWQEAPANLGDSAHVNRMIGLKAFRRFVVGLRDDIDRRLHPGRRRRAERRLRAIAPKSLLCVCLGNICRSPYAARLLAERAGPELRPGSAGFIGPGRPPPEHALAAARAGGVEHGDHRSKTLTPDMLADADVVLVFDRHNARRVRRTPGARSDRVFWLGDFDPAWAGRRAIPDPWGKPLEEFERTFERIERCVDELLRTLSPDGPEKT
jgi:protein-tyrosine phosphatase